MAKLSVIALMDCDSFFVSCEQLDNPDLAGKPVCVLGNNDGCVISRSKEAKKMGVRMGMPLFMAKKEFPNAIYVSSRYKRYVEISKRIMGLISTFSPNVEQYSIDEAFIDFTGLRKFYRKSYEKIACMIREEVLLKVGIPVSIGVSTSKTLAKLASHRAKNGNGVYLIGYKKIEEELKDTDISDVWGIGRNISVAMKKYGINSAYEFVCQDDKWLQNQLGIRGVQMKQELLGVCVSKVDNREVLPKSIQNTRSFASFSQDKEYIKNSIIRHINTSCRRLRELGLKAEAVKVMLRTKDFKYFVEKKQLAKPTSWDIDVVDAVIPIFEKIYNQNEIYRSSGIVLESLIKSEDVQMTLFENIERNDKTERLAKSIDNLSKKYKKNIVNIGYSQI